MTTEIAAASAPALHVLLIGIDRCTPAAPPAPVFRTLGGCTADVVAVAAYLRESKLAVATLIMLAEPPEGVERPDGAKRPTYANIVDAWQHLRDTVPASDPIYIHYAGHGARVPTIAPGDRASDDDEVIVPCDVNEPGGRYLRDLEIAFLLREMAARGQHVTLVMDSCHAAGVTEGPGPSTHRSIDMRDRRTDVVPSRVASHEALCAIARELRDRRAVGAGWAFGDAGGPGYTLIAACQADEHADEVVLPGGGRRGALTHCWLETLRRCGPDASYDTAFRRVFAEVRARCANQSPALVGDRRRKVLGTGVAHQPSGLVVLEVYRPEGTALGGVDLGGGAAAGVTIGSEYAIVPIGQAVDPDALADAPHVVVDRVKATRAHAKRTPALGPIARGDQAILWRRGAATEIHVPAPDELPALPPGLAACATATLERLRGAIRGDRGNLIACDGDGERDLRVAIDAVATPPVFVITTAGGAVLYGLGPAIEVDAPDAADALVATLRHVARFRSVRALRPGEDVSALSEALAVALWHRPAAGDPVQLSERARLVEGARLELHVENRAGSDLHLAILEVRADWTIVRVAAHRDATIIAPGEHWVMPSTATLPAAWPRSAPRDACAITRWKVIATRAPNDTADLALPPLVRRPVSMLEVPMGVGERPAPRVAVWPAAWLTVDVELETIAVGDDVVTRAG